MRNDIKLISKIVANMDKRWSLWEYEDDVTTKEEEELKEMKIKSEEKSANNTLDGEEDGEAGDVNNGENGNEKQHESSTNEEVKEEIKSEEVVDDVKVVKLKNPFLLNLNEYLVDEASNEEVDTNEQSTNSSEQKSENEKVASSVKFKKDLKLARVLDRLILYLRIVHSIDYYNVTEYQQEDWMPNRLGILHAREKSLVDKKIVKKAEIDEWIKQFETNIKSYVEYKERIEVDMAKRLGLKDSDFEVEKFLSENCKELEKDKWLCPLSGKKFKAKEYVHKHIQSKHADKIENVRKLCDFFNSFVLDPKRPYLPEHPLTRLNNTNNNNNSNLQNSDQQQMNNNNNNSPLFQMHHKPYYQNRYMQQQQSPHHHHQQQQPYYTNNQSALLPSPGMHYQNRPNYNYSQNYGYRPNPMSTHQPPMHNLRFKK